MADVVCMVSEWEWWYVWWLIGISGVGVMVCIGLVVCMVAEWGCV